MKPVSNKIEFVRGDTFYISRYFEDTEGTPLVLDAQTDEVTFTMRKDIESSEVLKKTITNSGVQILEDGKVVITINHSDTTGLDFGKYGYDIELTIGKSETNPFVRTPESGTIRLLAKDYSRPSNGGV